MNNQPGVLLDERTPEEKARDFKFEETVASVAPVQWIEKPVSAWRKFPISDQNGSGSCVAQTLAKMIGIYVWLKTGVFVKVSATHIYQRRSNKPAGGMNGVNAFKIAQEGVTLEDLAPSQNLTDAKMDASVVNEFMQNIGKAFAIGNFLTVQHGNIDTVASIIQETGKGVMVWFYFSTGLKPREWKALPEVFHTISLTGDSTARHSIAGVDFTLLGKLNLPALYKRFYGKKAIICDESWGLDKDVQDFGKLTDTIITINGQHIITEDFFKARNWFVGHFMNFKFEDSTMTPTPGVSKPKYFFTRDMEFSAVVTTSPDVVALQDILKYEGVLATNIQSTGYYGAITKTAVEKFQIKHALAQAGDTGFGRVGPKTRAKLNSLYGN